MKIGKKLGKDQKKIRNENWKKIGEIGKQKLEKKIENWEKNWEKIRNENWKKLGN